MPEVNKKQLHNIEPVPFVLGNFYKTQGGKLVRFVTVHNEGTYYETFEDESGVNRYSRRDFGRCTGTCHEYTHPLNVLPTYSIEVVDTLLAEIEQLKAQVAALQSVQEEVHISA